jgi:RNA polymerase sigma-70 factor (ECF subfamily)
LPEAIIFNLLHSDLLMQNDTAGFTLINADSSVVFENLFKANFKSLHAYAYSILKDDASAEEIVQQVFYKLWEKKDKLGELQSVPAYLYRAVHNDCLNLIKHSKVKAAHQAHTLRNSNELDNPTDQATLKEMQLKIDNAINELPEQCRIIFQLSRFEDMKYREIADRLGISVKTVENHMGKALRSLRTKLVAYLPVLALLFVNVIKLIK